MAVLWNPRGQNLILKWNMTIGYVKESDYKEKDLLELIENSGKTIQTQHLKHLMLQYGKS